MKASGGPQKLRFTVVSFSGEDSDYPVRELLFHSPQTRGWQTPRCVGAAGPPLMIMHAFHHAPHVAASIAVLMDTQLDWHAAQVLKLASGGAAQAGAALQGAADPNPQP